jgi:hypothetical protein
MSDDQALRSKLIRLAHANPELRADLLPLLKQAWEPEESADPATAWAQVWAYALGSKLQGVLALIEDDVPAARGLQDKMNKLHLALRRSMDPAERAKGIALARRLSQVL